MLDLLFQIFGLLYLIGQLLMTVMMGVWMIDPDRAEERRIFFQAVFDSVGKNICWYRLVLVCGLVLVFPFSGLVFWVMMVCAMVNGIGFGFYAAWQCCMQVGRVISEVPPPHVLAEV